MKIKCLAIFLIAPFLLAQHDLERELAAVQERLPASLLIAVVYNQSTLKKPTLPVSVGTSRIIAVPVRGVGDIGRMVVGDLLKNNAVSAVLVVEDNDKLLTHPRTLSHFEGLADGFGFDLFITPAVMSDTGLMVTWQSKRNFPSSDMSVTH